MKLLIIIITGNTSYRHGISEGIKLNIMRIVRC